MGGVLAKGVAEEARDALVDALRGELGGEGEVEAAFGAFRPAAVGGGEGGFSFAHAHWCFDDVEPRGVGGLDQGGLEVVRCDESRRRGFE